MTEFNKRNLIQFAKVAGFGLAAFIAVISFVGILNGVTGGLDAFYAWVGGINLIIEGFGFYTLFKKLFPKKEDKKEESK